jgi:hypothetical protein
LKEIVDHDKKDVKDLSSFNILAALGRTYLAEILLPAELA